MSKRLVEIYAIAHLPSEDEIRRYVQGEVRTRPKATTAKRYVFENEDGSREVIEIPLVERG